MLSTPFDYEIYLGFAAPEPTQQPSHETTFVGGRPIFLREPEKKHLSCQNCPNHPLTFMCQVFCPLEADHCYNRVLYIFFCEKCQREFKCLKQQTKKQEAILNAKVDVRTALQKCFEVESQSLQLKELDRIRSKAKRGVQQEAIEQMEEQEFEEEGEDIDIKEIQVDISQLGLDKQQTLGAQLGEEKLEGLKVASQNMQQTKKQEKDPIFEEYRKVMQDLDGPILLYSNIPIPYNKDPINPRHNCKYCKAKLTPQLQITEKILLLSPKLVGLDWGSLIVFTCSKSCQESIEECVVVQYEADAVKDSEVSALKKKQKNRKRKDRSKQKKEKKEEGAIEEEEREPQKKEQDEKQEEGDWD